MVARLKVWLHDAGWGQHGLMSVRGSGEHCGGARGTPAVTESSSLQGACKEALSLGFVLRKGHQC